jgi:hypothetical protein
VVEFTEKAVMSPQVVAPVRAAAQFALLVDATGTLDVEVGAGESCSST